MFVQEEAAASKQERERHNKITERVAKRMKKMELLRALNRFSEAVEESLRKRQLLQRVKNSCTNFALATSFETWVFYMAELAAKRQNGAFQERVSDVLCFPT